ncbi:hypothetical protein HGRIS_010772 [Hohenbuehelia grisea]|uniref:Uncharacterized protein n=1 Tax=Hohenbuehelia grisea TaxID=104357 RepID=A0ABR3IXW9_9AGAR
MPPEQPELASKLHDIGWQFFCEKVAGFEDILIPSLVYQVWNSPEGSLDPQTVFNVSNRLKAGIQWLEFCRDQFISGHGEQTDLMRRFLLPQTVTEPDFNPNKAHPLQLVMVGWETLKKTESSITGCRREWDNTEITIQHSS